MEDAMSSAAEQDRADVFAAERGLLFGVAYRVLGRVADAEDVVQEAWLRWSAADRSDVAEPRGFLVTITTRLAIDRLRLASARRESYVGPWLPEPLVTSPDVAEEVEVAETVSMAMLVVLETLSPLERAVFVLREAFAYSYAEIAAILDRGEPAVRQLAHRAREHVRAAGPRFETDQATRRTATEQFLRACGDGDLEALLGILAPDVTLVGDGGGLAKAPLRPITGADKVARFMLAIAATGAPEGDRYLLHLAPVNGAPGFVISGNHGPVAAFDLVVADGLIRTVHLIANPEKLTGLRDLPGPAAVFGGDHSP
jgi:RNA polymerase sigma-70 factor (ECF subfamily)